MEKACHIFCNQLKLTDNLTNNKPRHKLFEYATAIKYGGVVWEDLSSEIRRLTILELKRIQSFSDNFTLCGTKKDQIMQIGNAVASRFAYHLGRHLINILQQ